MNKLLSATLLPLVACSSTATPSPDTALQPRVSAEATPAESLEPAKVVYALRGHEQEYRKCFMRAVQERGHVELAFSVDLTGRVTETSVTHSTIAAAHVTDCLTGQLSKEKFGRQDQVRTGRWTFVFRLTDPIPAKNFAARLRTAKSAPDGAVQLSPTSRGQLDPAAIEDITLASYPLYARCYRDSIQRLEDNGGLLRLRLTIEESGRVSQLTDAGSVLPDPFAVDCIAEGFYAMKFPAPSGGPVEATYRLDFE